MKISIALTCLIILCSCTNQETVNATKQLTKKCDSLIIVNQQLNDRIASLSDSLILLSYSASDRLVQIKRLVIENKIDSATDEILTLKRLFPMAKEISECGKQEFIIANIVAKQKAEEERIKALGYKAFTDHPTSIVGTSKFSISGFNFGRTYTFDYCSDVDEYSYRTADKDNTYILASLSLTSKDKGYVSTPSINVYEIVNGNLKRLAWFSCEYSTWESYGAKIGNYSDDSHDFSKVNTVRYNLAAEISKDYMNKPLVVLTNIDGESIGDSLTIDDVKQKCIVIKILNRNKL